MNKEHRHKYRLKMGESVMGLVHCWAIGNCVAKIKGVPCGAPIKKYVNVSEIEKTGNIIFRYYLYESK
jgi:hypothetical protein